MWRRGWRRFTRGGKPTPATRGTTGHITGRGGPRLADSLKNAISLEFRDATLKNVFEAIARGTSLNFVFDRDVRQDVRTTIFVRNSSIEDVLRFVLVTNQLDKKVLSENTVLVFPNTP